VRIEVKYVFAAGVIAFLLSACSRGSADAGGNLPLSNTPPVIGLALSNGGNPFSQELRQGAEAAAQENNLSLVTVDAGNDTLKQIGEIRQLIAQKVSVLLVNPTNSNDLSGAVEMANKAGIPVITLGSPVAHGRVACQIGSDNFAGGRMAGEYIKAHLGKHGCVVELLGVPQASASIERDRGFLLALQPSAGIRLVARVAADFDQSEAVRAMRLIVQQQGHVDAVFALDDEMALGAVAALHQSGDDHVLVVGFDASQEGLEGIRTHRMAATIAQRPDLIGWEGVMTARKLIDHLSVERYIPIPLELVTL
jgi:ribose transport system substrate-binding protein